MPESGRMGLVVCWFGLGLVVLALLMQGGVMAQQGKIVAQSHADDTSVPASPVGGPTSVHRADDSSVPASPVTAEVAPASLKVGTVLRVQLAKALDSGTLHEGDNLTGKLVGGVRTSAGQAIAAGASVTATVVSAAPAGKIASAGELSLQVTKVGTVAVVSDVLSFEGQEGHKDLPDSAPAKGTDAKVAAGRVLTFRVAPEK